MDGFDGGVSQFRVGQKTAIARDIKPQSLDCCRNVDYRTLIDDIRFDPQWEDFVGRIGPLKSPRGRYGPTMSAFEAAEKSGKVEELHDQLLELAKAQNKSADGSTSIPAIFLRAIVSL